METNERLKQFEDYYHEALIKRYCDSKKSFAQFIGFGKTSVSAAFNGSDRYLTDSLLDACQKAIAQADAKNATISIVMENDGESHDNIQKNFAPSPEDANINEIVDKFIAELAAQRESHERIMMALIESKK